MKKLFIISGSLFLLVLAFLGVYNFAFKHNTTNPVADPAKKEALEQKRAADDNAVSDRPVVFQQIIPGAVQSPVAGESGILYYSPRDGALKEVTFDGKPVATHLDSIPGIPSRIVWSPSRQSALLLIRQDGSDLWHSASLRNKSVAALKPGMARLAWTSLGDRIFYQYTDPASSERTLNISAADGSSWSKLADFGTEDRFIAAVPRSSSVAFWQKTDGNRESALEVINFNGENRHTLLTGRFGADFLWSPDGLHLLVQSVTERGGQTLNLGITDATGGDYRNLLSPTLVSKIAWSKDSETFYYALPGPFPDGTVLPNDYFGKPLHTKDTFWKMNIRTGKKERLVPLEEMTEAFDATNLFLSPAETDLYFVDRSSERLFRIML